MTPYTGLVAEIESVPLLRPCGSTLLGSQGQADRLLAPFHPLSQVPLHRGGVGRQPLPS